MKSLNHVQLLVASWTVALQAPRSMGFCRQEYWNGLPFPSPGDLPQPGIEFGSPVFQAYSLPTEPPRKFRRNIPQHYKGHIGQNHSKHFSQW